MIIEYTQILTVHKELHELCLYDVLCFHKLLLISADVEVTVFSSGRKGRLR